MPRKKRSDSVDETVRVAKSAYKKIKSENVKLSKTEKKIFDEIIGEKAAADWTSYEITCAAILAQMTVDFIKTKDNQTMNTILSMRRSIGIHFAKEKDTRDQRKKNRAGLKVQEGIQNHKYDDLLAHPTMN